MNIFEMMLIGTSLAIDASSVSICKGLSMDKISIKKSIIIGIWFGLFQFLMPLIGFYTSSSFGSLISSFDHWISFGLLLFIGTNMILDSIKSSDKNNDSDTSFKTMLVLSIATSIDALAVGIAYFLAYGSINAYQTFIVIGIITFFLSFISVIIGNKLGNLFNDKAGILGGIALIVIGIKILLEHLNIFI